MKCSSQEETIPIKLLYLAVTEAATTHICLECSVYLIKLSWYLKQIIYGSKVVDTWIREYEATCEDAQTLLNTTWRTIQCFCLHYQYVNFILNQVASDVNVWLKNSIAIAENLCWSISQCSIGVLIPSAATFRIIQVKRDLLPPSYEATTPIFVVNVKCLYIVFDWTHIYPDIKKYQACQDI
jgi:hypothetical protein